MKQELNFNLPSVDLNRFQRTEEKEDEVSLSYLCVLLAVADASSLTGLTSSTGAVDSSHC